MADDKAPLVFSFSHSNIRSVSITEWSDDDIPAQALVTMFIANAMHMKVGDPVVFDGLTGLKGVKGEVVAMAQSPNPNRHDPRNPYQMQVKVWLDRESYIVMKMRKAVMHARGR